MIRGAGRYSTLITPPRRVTLPRRVPALLTDNPEVMLELGDFERCVAWALLD